jgi:hypothetical protein
MLAPPRLKLIEAKRERELRRWRQARHRAVVLPDIGDPRVWLEAGPLARCEVVEGRRLGAVA